AAGSAPRVEQAAGLAGGTRRRPRRGLGRARVAELPPAAPCSRDLKAAMTAYLLRRLLYAIPILIGVNVITFVLFFVVNSPDDMARLHLGERHVTQADIDKWKAARGYDRPLVYNPEERGLARLTDTIFFESS